jgi:hypothetical protein
MKEKEIEESIRTLDYMLGYLELIQSEIDGYVSYLCNKYDTPHAKGGQISYLESLEPKQQV